MENHDGATVLFGLRQPVQVVGWLLLVLLVPLGINLWGQQPFELPKVALLQTLVWLLAGLTLAEYLEKPRALRRIRRMNPLFGPVCLLAVVLVVTTVTAVDWRLSLWGSSERSQGAITHLTYLLLFWLAAEQLRPLSRARLVITAMAATAGPLVLLSLMQQLGWDPFGLVTDARSPIYATLGRANFVGAYLVILLPLTLAVLFTASKRRSQMLWAVLFLGELGIIGLSLARSAWLGTAVSLFSFALLRWGPKLARRWQRLGWGVVGLFFLSGPLSVWWLGQGQAGSTAARLAIWQGVWKLIGQRPFLGYGADALGIIFPRVYPPELVYYQGRDFFVDRAHNLFLDWTVMAGLPGLLAFSLVLVTFFIVVGRELRQDHQPPEKRALLIAILAAVLGNTANNLVSFDVTPTTVATWLLMGLGVALAVPQTVPENVLAGKRPFQHWVLVGLTALLVGMVIWQVNGRPLLADIAARSAHRYALAGNWPQSTAAAERAVTYWPSEPAHHLLLGQSYWQQAVAEPAAAHDWLMQAEIELGTAVQLRPEDPNLWRQLAEFYSAAARQFNTDTRSLAETAFRQAAALAPNQAAIYTVWGRTYLEADDPETAAPLLRTAVKLDASSGEAYIHLGAAELALGRLEIALADYREAVRLEPESARAYTGLAQAYWQLNRPKEALAAVTEALRHDPLNEQAIAIRQAIYRSP